MTKILTRKSSFSCPPTSHSKFQIRMQNGKQEKEKVKKKTHVDNSPPLYSNTYFTSISTLSNPIKIEKAILFPFNGENHTLSLYSVHKPFHRLKWQSPFFFFFFFFFFLLYAYKK
jgi:hypothetical protein